MKPIRVNIIVVLLIFASSSLMGDHQENDSPKSGVAEKHASVEIKQDSFINCLLKNQAAILTSPFRINGKEWLIWAGVGALTGIMITYDQNIYREIKEFQSRHSWIDSVSPVVTLMGDGLFNLAVTGSFYLGGILSNNNRARETARLLLMTIIHTGFTSQLLKHLSGRQRPSVDDGRDGWVGPGGFFKRYSDDISKYDAFPSGHTIVAWGTATVIAHMYRDRVLVSILSYLMATMVGLSRVTEDTHWLSDVFLGAVLGYAIGRFVVKNRCRRWMVLPAARSDGMSIGLYHIL